jgi:hypothetical protein
MALMRPEPGGPAVGASVPAGDEGSASAAPVLRLQVFSDLHLETERFDPAPAPGADALILAGDIDATWQAYERFAGWPVPVFAVAGNHEFDGREWLAAWPALRDLGERLGITWLEHESVVLPLSAGGRVRLVGATRWSDFGVFGEPGRAKAEKAAAYFQSLMAGSIGGRPLDVGEVKAIAAASRARLVEQLAEPTDADATVAITHFAPSLRCADPRYGQQPGTASFCNADDDLLPHADLWVHGHLHCRHDFTFDSPRPGAPGHRTRVVSRARGHLRRGEALGYDREPPLVTLPLRWIGLTPHAVWNTAGDRSSNAGAADRPVRNPRSPTR